MKVARFDWDEENANHVAAHHVECDEAESVFQHNPLILRGANDKNLACGHTDDGRYILVVFVENPIRAPSHHSQGFDLQ